MKLLVATTNAGKFREITEMLAERSSSPLEGEVKVGGKLESLSLRDFPALTPYEETGDTFEANSVGKATYYAKHSGLLTLAEDSGITVPSLSIPGFDAHHPEPGRQTGGVPGVYSAHFAETPREANLKLLAMLLHKPDTADARYAFYCCVACLAWPDGRTVMTVGTCEGVIAPEPRGEGGFGYDPIFYYPPFGRTFGETPSDLKNRVSHRAIALRALLPSITA